MSCDNGTATSQPNATVLSGALHDILSRADQPENGSLCSPDYPDMMLGTREDYLSEGALIAVTVIYAAVFLVGVLGNVAVGLAVWGRRELRKATNYFLVNLSATNYFLVNLSVADLLLLLVCMPTALLETWVPMPWLLGEVMLNRLIYSRPTLFRSSQVVVSAVGTAPSKNRNLAAPGPLKQCEEPPPFKILATGMELDLEAGRRTRRREAIYWRMNSLTLNREGGYG
ncbi:hypothetical protein Bbelb_170660 [Branchiostoma belcheri]|nr:hypothetical protein Bbelb_170660 [Branchiostoma belcheri]